MSVKVIMEKADKQMDYGSYKKAFKLYEQALDILEEPKVDQLEFLEIEAAICDVLISMGKNGEAVKRLDKLFRIDDVMSDAYFNLRRGQLAFEMNDLSTAKTYLSKALEIGGDVLFEGEYEEYYFCAKGIDA